MQQRQLRLGDILDDYCPRERRVTNHAVVAMVGDDVKQTRCTTCDTEHEFKHGKVPRQRRKSETPAALYAQVAANAPKRVAHAAPSNGADADADADVESDESTDAVDDTAPADDDTVDVEAALAQQAAAEPPGEGDESQDADEDPVREEGPVHRPLIRASLPRPEGQQPTPRPIPEFTIRQPTGRPGGGRFRPRHPRGVGGGGGGGQFQGNRSNGNVAGPPRGMRPGGGRPPQGGPPRGPARREGPPGRSRRPK